MKCKLPLLFLCASLFLIIPAYGDSQTHTLNTSIFHFKLDNDGRIKFDADIIHLGDSRGLWYWIDDDGIGFYNLRMDSSNCPANWYIKVSENCNVTVTKLFEEEELGLTISASTGQTSTTIIYCADKGEPKSVTGVRSWTYDSSSQTVSISVVHESSQDVTLSWRENQASGYYTLSVYLKQDSQPLAGVTVSVKPMLKGEDKVVNKTTKQNGIAEFQLHSDNYIVHAYHDDKIQTMMVWLTTDKAIGFDFSSPPTYRPRLEGLILVPILIVFAYLLLRRAKK